MPHIVVAYIRENRIAPYLEALRACGVRDDEIYLATPARTAEVDLDELVRRSDGLLLTGGADLQPCLYREARLPGIDLDPPVAERDQMEWDLLHHARAGRVPVFGICRGFQLLNVFLGGTLYQDLAAQRGIAGHDCFADRGYALDHLAHSVVAAATAHPFADRLRSWAPFATNSRHHQGIKQLAAGLVPCAHAADGVLEAAAAAADDWWARGVQWHPENLVGRAEHRALFADFVAEATTSRQRRKGAPSAIEVGG